MGVADAQQDGVRMGQGKYGTEYYPCCFFCLREVRSQNYIAGRRYVCPACKPLIKTFKAYYADKSSRTLFEAIDREARAAPRPPDL